MSRWRTGRSGVIAAVTGALVAGMLGLGVMSAPVATAEGGGDNSGGGGVSVPPLPDGNIINDAEAGVGQGGETDTPGYIPPLVNKPNLVVNPEEASPWGDEFDLSRELPAPCDAVGGSAQVCSPRGGGVVYRGFAASGYGGEGNAYSNRRLPIALELIYLGYESEPGPCPALDSSGNLPGGYRVVDETENQCVFKVDGYTRWIEANPRVTYPTYSAISGASCNTMYTYPGITLDNGQPYRAPYVGYKVRWSLGDGVFENVLSTYECLPPAQARIMPGEPCYTTLFGKIDAYMPDLRFDGPRVGPRATMEKTGPVNWLLTMDPIRTVYAEKRNTAMASGRMADNRAALYECRKEREELVWDFDRAVNKWGWGKFDTQLSATYDKLTVVQFVAADAFGGRPQDFVLWNQSQIDDPDNFADYKRGVDGDSYKAWRTVVHLYCYPGSTADDGLADYAREEYRPGWDPYRSWWNNKRLPTNPRILYTADDCKGANGISPSWRCSDDGFQSWDTATTLGYPYFVETQADNLNRPAKWGPLNITGQGVRDVRDRRIYYLASPDSSPRLADSKVYNEEDQPFEIFVRDETNPQLKYQLRDRVPGWSDEDRTLNMRFREASTENADFSVHPKYIFTAEFSMAYPSVQNYNISTGAMSITEEADWFTTEGTCDGDELNLEVLRVGAVPE